ncbi:hypothetical protein ABPG74_012583 [Tetrahymena malaccensis]
MATVQAKIDQLEKEIKLTQLGRDLYLTQEVSENDIKAALDQKDIFEQLIDRMKEKQRDQTIKTISWKNFFLTYIEAEQLLSQKIVNARKILEDCYKKRNEVQDKLIEARSSEVLNQHGIAFNSHLTVTVRNINLNVPSNVQPYVQIQVGLDQSHQTTNAFGNQATFNNTFEFKINTGQESIQINVMNYDRASQDTLLGSVTIPLSILKDQYPRENEYQLLGYDKNEIGSIFLSLQWLHSQEKYLSDTLAQWDEHIKQQEEELYDFEKDLSLLYSPFPQYVQLFRNDIKIGNTQFVNQGATNIGYKIDDQPGLIMNQNPEYEKIDLRGVALQGYIEIDQNIFQPVKLLLGVFFILTLLIHIYRPNFVDLLICLTTILFYELHIFDHQRAKFLLIAIGVSCFLDFFWLLNFSSGWWSDVYDHTNILIEDSSFKKFVVCMSYLSFFVKFPLAFFVMKLWRELEAQLQGKTVVKEKLLNTLNFNRSPEYAAAQIPYSQVYVPPQGSINRQYIVPSVSNQPGFGLPIQQSYIVSNPQQSLYGGNVQQANLAQTNIQQQVQIPYQNLAPSYY